MILLELFDCGSGLFNNCPLAGCQVLINLNLSLPIYTMGIIIISYLSSYPGDCEMFETVAGIEQELHRCLANIS